MNKLQLRKIIREEIQREVYNKKLEISVKEINSLLERALAVNESIGKRNSSNYLMIENVILKAQKTQRLDELKFSGFGSLFKMLKKPAALLGGIGIPAAFADKVVDNPAITNMIQTITQWAAKAPPGIIDGTGTNGMVAVTGLLTLAAVVGLLVKSAKSDEEKKAVADLQNDTEQAMAKVGATLKTIDAGSTGNQGALPK